MDSLRLCLKVCSINIYTSISNGHASIEKDLLTLPIPFPPKVVGFVLFSFDPIAGDP